MTYPNLTACSSVPEARICIFLVPFVRKHFDVYGHERNVVEFNTIYLAKDNTKKETTFLLYFFVQKGHNVLFQPRCNLDFGH
jgi:hypothetical protein